MSEEIMAMSIRVERHWNPLGYWYRIYEDDKWVGSIRVMSDDPNWLSHTTSVAEAKRVYRQFERRR